MDEQTIFSQALAIESDEERSKFLDSACGDDRELRARIERLLRLQEDAGSFLEKTPDELVALAETKADESESESADRWKESLEPSDDPNSLGRLGPYEIAELIGRGGMGVVLRAFDSKLKRTVAIKILAPEFTANPMAVRRFLREARSAAAVSHDHVVTIHAIDEETQPPRIVMECVDGQSLQQKIDNEGALDLKSILRIGMQTASGLSAAHKQGLVHRDIKPSNILLENGIERVKLTDFGLARAVDDIGVTRTGQITGTPQYMSPEQAQGHRVDHRTDLFSLGCVLYAMCTGRAAFRADSAVAVMHRVVHDTPKPIREANEEIPEWLCEIVDKLLEKDPENRFESANEVEELLGRHLAHMQQPQSVPRPGSIGPTLSSVHQQVKQELSSAGRIFLGLGLACLMVFVLTLLGLSNFNFWLSMWPLSMTLPVLIGGIISLPVGLLALNAHFELPRRSGYRWIRMAAGAALIPWNPFLLLAFPWTLRIRRMLLRPEVKRELAVTMDQISSVPLKSGSLRGAPAKLRIVALVGLLVLCLTELFDATNFNDSIERAIAGQGELLIETDVPESVITLSGDGFSLKSSGSLRQKLPTGSYEVDILHQFENGAVGQRRVEYKIGRRETVSDYIPLLRQGVINASQISEFLSDGPNAAKLTVSLEDPNAELRLNGKIWNIAGKGPQLLPLKPGRYQFLGFVGNVKQIDQAITLKAGDQRALIFEKSLATQFESPDGQALSLPSGSSAELLTSDEYEWTEPENLGPLVNSSDMETAMTLSSDNLMMVFTRVKRERNSQNKSIPTSNLWQTTRASFDAPWSQPVDLSATLNSSNSDNAPCLSADGLTLIFSSNREGGEGGFDLWMSSRKSRNDEWSKPVNLGNLVNSDGGEFSPTISEDQLTLIFGSKSFAEISQTLEAITQKSRNIPDLAYDFLICTRKSKTDPWSKPVNLVTASDVNLRGRSPMLAEDGLSLLLKHPPPSPSSDLYVSTRPTRESRWSKPIHLVPRIDPKTRTLQAHFFSLRQQTLYYSAPGEGDWRNLDLWMTKLVRKSPRDVEPTAHIDPADFLLWSELLSQASSIPLNEWNTLAGDIKGPNAVAVRGEPLSLVLLNLDPVAEQKQNEHVIRDFWYLTETLPKPQELANAISVSKKEGYVSFLQPERMTNLTFEEADGTVEGSVGFSVPKLYSGRVEFMARRYDDNIWRIDEFRLPNYEITLRRNTQNLWQKVRTTRNSGNRAEGSRSSP